MDKLTRFERARLISARALQLSLGAPLLIKDAKEFSMRQLARLELEKKVIPLSVLREMPNGEVKRIEVS